MNRAQRVILALYCLLIAYCIVWVPWCIEHRSPRQVDPTKERVGYGWLWGGPNVIDLSAGLVPNTDPYAKYGGSEITVSPSELTPVPSVHTEYARPDFTLIAMRLIAVTAFCIAATLLAGMNWKNVPASERK